ncbi:unnamed protein product [Closterium sp. NIES-53]
MPAERTVEEVGICSVPIRSGGYQKERVSVMLACTASGEKLKPWVFFKCKTIPKGNFPSGKPSSLCSDGVICMRYFFLCLMLICPYTLFGCADVVVAAHLNCWMDADSVLAWLDGTVNPYVNPMFGIRSRKVMLVLDSYRGHLTDAVKAKFGELNIVPAVIPAGCTSEIQPLDVAVNRSFKVAVRQLYQEWFESEGVDCLTERGELNPYVYDVSAFDCFHPVLIDVVFPCVAGNIRKPPPELTLKWISKAWKVVPKELIQRSFLTCGISNALDGSQDNLCMKHRRDAVKGEVELDDEIAADGFCCNNVEEPELDGEADQDGSATVDGDA